MARGEARLGPLRIVWDVPGSFPEAAGGLEHLAAAGDATHGALAVTVATWSLRAAEPGQPPSRYEAFFGSARLVLGARETRVWGPDADLVITERQVEGVVSGPATGPASLALHALAAHAGLAHVHAALVRLANKTILAPGGTGAGKTSAALAIGRHGGELLADDVVYVDHALVAWPVRRPPHVTDATLGAHPGIEVLGPVRDGVLAKLRVRPPIAGPGGPATVDAIVLPTIDPRGPTRVEPIEAAAVFPALVGTSALVAVEGSPRREELLDLLASLAEVPAARLVAGPDALRDPALLPAVLAAWLDLG